MHTSTATRVAGLALIRVRQICLTLFRPSLAG